MIATSLKPALGFSAIIGALMVAGHFERQDDIAADMHYCEMVSIQKRWIADHPMEIGREAAARRPGWPEHRWDVDCKEFGFFFDQKFSSR